MGSVETVRFWVQKQIPFLFERKGLCMSQKKDWDLWNFPVRGSFFLYNSKSKVIRYLSGGMQRIFTRASHVLADRFERGFSNYDEKQGDHTVLLHNYGPSRIGITHYDGGLGLFKKGYLIRAEAENGREASDFINAVQRELAPLTLAPAMTEYGAGEARNRQEKDH